jgi:hypothetical protein
MKANAAINSPIILISQTEGGLNAPGGVTYATHSLAHLLSLAAISNARYQHLTAEGFVDIRRAGFKSWGHPDAFMAEHGIGTSDELKTWALGARNEG